MTDRFNPAHIIISSYRQLQVRQPEAGKDAPDRLARFLVISLPTGTLALTVGHGIIIHSGDAILAGVGILAGAFMASFGQLASWRAKLTADGLESDDISCRRIDEASAHTLAGTAAGVLLTALLVVSVTLGPERPEAGYPSILSDGPKALLENGLSGLFDRILFGGIAAVAIYLLLLLLMSISLFWTAYEEINEVPRGAKRREVG